MYFDFFSTKIVNWQYDEENMLHWTALSDKFVRVCRISIEDIISQENRLAKVGYFFPNELKAFWTEIGCGYLCPSEVIDNGFESPSTVIDLYLNEGNWVDVKLSCDLFAPNELPFFQIGHLDYITIGIEPNVNLGKIYRLGIEIAPNLIDFVKRVFENPTYYNEFIA